jgi:hypothetical protein
MAIRDTIKWVTDRADQLVKSDEVAALKKSTLEGMVTLNQSATDIVKRIKGNEPSTLYGQTASACEEVNDALLGETNGTTSKMTKIAAAKFGAVGTSAGIFGIAATVGTAGTGTAIGALSGAAATSATLAWIGGSVAMGSVIVGTAAVAGGVGFAAGALWVFKKYWCGKKRIMDALSESEQRIAEVTGSLAVACKRFENEGKEPDPKAARAIYEETLAPLCAQLMDEQGRHSDWPPGAIQRLKQAVSHLNDAAMRVQHLGSKSRTVSISMFATVITMILQHDLSDLTVDQELVLEALRRSRNDLDGASEEKLIEYVSSLSDSQLDGVINNVKGMYHELLFTAAENSDGDEYSAFLFEETNYPGADVILTNEITGETEAVQLKATQYRSYIREHQDRYQEYEVFATEEVAANIDGVEGSGFTNEKVTGDTETVIDGLQNAGDSVVDDAMATSAMIALAFQLGRIIRSRDLSKSAARQTVVEVSKSAFLSGFVAWAVE